MSGVGMSQTRIALVGFVLFIMGLGISGSFPHGTMIAGGLSWDWVGGMVAGIGIAMAWFAAAERMGRA